MAELEQALRPRRQYGRRKVFVLHGLGGIGKTQLAIEFARRYWRRFSSVFWLDGRTEESLKQSIVAIAKLIPKGQIPEASRSYAHGNSDDVDNVIHDVLCWFSLVQNTKWLLIFDNVDRDHSPILKDTDAYDFRRYLP